MNRIEVLPKVFSQAKKYNSDDQFVDTWLTCPACNKGFRFELNRRVLAEFSYCPFCGTLSELQVF